MVALYVKRIKAGLGQLVGMASAMMTITFVSTSTVRST